MRRKAMPEPPRAGPGSPRALPFRARRTGLSERSERGPSGPRERETMTDRSDETSDRLALRRLAEQYARGADTRDAELYADVFTDDGVLVTTRGEVTGR